MIIKNLRFGFAIFGVRRSFQTTDEEVVESRNFDPEWSGFPVVCPGARLACEGESATRERYSADFSTSRRRHHSPETTRCAFNEGIFLTPVSTSNAFERSEGCGNVIN